MGKFLNKFKKNIGIIDKKANEIVNKKKRKEFRGGRIREKKQEKISEDIFRDDFEEDDNFEEDNYGEDRRDFYDEVGILPSQKPESFHHFILENQYRDLEKSIRGYKEVFDKHLKEWKTIRKQTHCFTDEEAEEILRTAQSHLATDIKLSFINRESFGAMMMAIYKRIDELFTSIAEYRYGRYSHNEDGSLKENAYEIEYQMKIQNRKIFLELWARIQANYSRAIQGQENKYTHDSVKGQESLQQTDNDYYENKRYS